jgi:hypothetical protein
MKKMLALVLCMMVSTAAIAGGTVETVCHDKLDKKGQVVKDKKGNVVQNCKKIKVHKKLEGTPLPETK